jgi:hypothetical protein
MAGQCLRGQPEAAWGSLHQAAPGAPHLGTSTGEHTRSTNTGASSASSSSARHCIRGARRWWIPRGKTTQISSERRQSTIPIGGVERGRREECFAQGGDSGDHRGWPERPGGGGGDPASLESSSSERGGEGAGLGRLTDPDPSRFGLTEPVRPAGPNGPRPFYSK